jgi:outer membrane biosynthesis protein TonB
VKNRAVLLIVLVPLLALLLLACSLGGVGAARVTATPTKTPRALFTATLTAAPVVLPSDTPAPANTPVPPTATPLPTDPPTIAPPTATTIPPTDLPLPTDTPIPPTQTQPPPTNTPRPAATRTPAPPTNTPQPTVDFKVKEIVAFEDGSLMASGAHNIYFQVIDAAGAALDGIILEEVNNQPPVQVTSGDKGPGKAEFTMWAADYRFRIVGNTTGEALSSETTHVLSILFEHAVWDDLIRGGICADEASCRNMGSMHFSYNVTFQRTW